MANEDVKDLFGQDDIFEGTLIKDEAPKEKQEFRRTVGQWKARFTDFQSQMQDNRKQQLKNYRYFNKEQLTRGERDKLAARGQPDIIINRFRVAVHGIMGVVIHSETQPIALPVRPGDEGSSDVATEVLRFSGRINNFKSRMKSNLKDYLLGGCTALMVAVQPDGRPDFIHIRWEEFFYDPRSRCEMFSDARYMGFIKWMYADEVKELRPEDEEFARAVDAAMESGLVGGGGAYGFDDTFDDRPIDKGWIDNNTKRVLVVEIYEKIKGVWVQCMFWDGGILVERDSPYLDAKGRPSNPIVAVSCYVNDKNERQAYAYDLIDIQDEINKRRQKALWEASASQIQAADPSAIEVSADEARREAARPDGVIPYGWAIARGADRSGANMALLSEAKNEMERFSPNPAMLGRQGADTSGKALLARQQAGLIELAPVLSQFEDWQLEVWKATWARVRQYWTAADYLRLTDDPEDLQFLAINEPIAPQPEQPMLDEEGQPMVGSDGNPIMIPAMEGTELGYNNQLAEMDVDVMIDTAPDTASIREAQMSELRQILATNPNYADQVPFEVIMELTNLPRKREIMKKIKAHRQAAEQAAAEQAKKDEAKQDAVLQSQLAVEQSEAQRNQMEGQAKMMSAQQGEIRTAVQADKTLAGIDAEATRVQMEGAQTTADVLSKAQPVAGASGEDGPPTE